MATLMVYSMKAIVIGGGIGGLTAAIALNRVGIDAEVYERASELREVGAGISLWANAVHALDQVGLGKAVRAQAISGVSGGLRSSHGAVLQSGSYDELTRRFGAAVIMMHRQELLAMLANEAGPERLHLNYECTGVEQNTDAVSARFANGETVRGDVLIGADGLRSVVREKLFGDGPPRYAGYTAWRAVTRFDHASMVAGETWGRGRRFGMIPLAGGRVYWFATMNAPEGDRESESETKRRVLGLFRGWHEPIPSLIEATAGSAILRNDIYDRDPLTRWSHDRATLLGDAAHPMTPNLGQGACQAMEDAVVLADCLKKCATAAAGLREYEQRRIPRTSRIVLESRRVGEIGQWENRVLCWFRDTAVRATPRKFAERRISYLVGSSVG